MVRDPGSTPGSGTMATMPETQNPLYMIVDKQRMKMIGDVLSTILKGKGFALLVFDFGDEPKMANYISNAKREDMEKALEETLKRWKERKEFMTPGAN